MASISDLTNNLSLVPAGHHYMVIYPSLKILREVYATFIKREIADRPNSVILFLPFYDSPQVARGLIFENGTDPGNRLIIRDINQVISNDFFKVPDIDKLRALVKKMEEESQDKEILVIADMSIFHHNKKAPELLEYERKLHKELKEEKWKEICLYNKIDFDAMFTEGQKQELLDFHKDRVINF
jgi:hypothetical protein